MTTDSASQSPDGDKRRLSHGTQTGAPASASYAIDPALAVSGATKQRQNALARWHSEGGAGPEGAQKPEASGQDGGEAPPLTNAELVQLRIRVIAVESLLIAMLADGSDQQIERAVEMAEHIMPRPGYTRHPLTIQAASHVLSLVERSGRRRQFKANPDPVRPEPEKGESG